MSTLIAEYIDSLKLADTLLSGLIDRRPGGIGPDTAPLPLLCIIDKNFRVLYADVACRPYFPQAKDGEAAQLPEGLTATASAAALRRVLDKGSTESFVAPLTPPQGQTVYFEFVAFPMRNDNGETLAARLTATDISERLARQQKHWKDLQLHQTLIDSFPDIIVRHDRNHRYLFANKAIERIAGIPPKEVIGKSFLEAGFPPKACLLWQQRCDAVFASGLPVTFDTEFPSPRGIIRVETMLIPEFSSSGHAESILAICRPGPRQLRSTLQAMEKINAELLRQKRYLSTILENIPMIISRFDRQFRHIYVSPASENLYGIPAEQLLGKTWADMGMDQAAFLQMKAYYEEAFLTGQALEFEAQFPNVRGETAHFLINVIPESNDGKEVRTVLSIAQDITARKNFETEMLRLDRLNIVGEMAASIGHEVRNPLTTVRGYLQFFQTKAPSLPYAEQFATMIEELDRANTIISEFLSLAKNKSIKFKIANLNTIIKKFLPLITADALRCGHNVHMELSPVADISLDEKELRQLLLNLSRNAFEAMNSGGTLTIKSYMEGDCPTLAVLDDGPGIPALILEKMGTPFLTTKENGVGLGLAVCYRIAERHNAKIDVKASPSGTAFFITFKAPAE